MNFFKSVSQTIFSVFFALIACCGMAYAGTALDGEIKIQNERFSRVSIHVDGEYVGRLKPKEIRVFKSIPNGVRLIRFVDGQHKELVQRLAVPVAGRAQIKIAAIGGKAVIRTSSSSRLRVSIDGKYVGTVKSGRKLISPILVNGIHTLTATPISGVFRKRKPMTRTFRVQNGEFTDIQLEGWFASLTVRNPENRRVRLYIDGRRVRRIGAAATVTISDIDPGVRRLTLKRRGRIIAEKTMNVGHGAHEKWSPRVSRSGSMRVTNRMTGPVWIEIDGQLQRGIQIEAGESEVFPALTEGQHTVTVISRRAGRQNHRVRIRSGHTARIIAFNDDADRKVSRDRRGNRDEHAFIRISANSSR